MSVTGPNIKTFLEGLTPQSFVQLTADLLARKDHRDVKVMDGPGDGCRDIHSVDSSGERWLTQCKFHEDSSKTVASKEIGELPLGMVKLDYSHGYFATNSKISPQAKREFKDNFPKLSLDYFEGKDIVNEVLGDSVLRALWFNGESLGRVTFLVTLPVVARDLSTDRAIHHLLKGEIADRNIFIPTELESVSCKLRASSVEARLFKPYRSPMIKTHSESWHSQIYTIEAILTGTIPFDGLDQLFDTVGIGIVKFLAELENNKARHFSLRYGTAQLAPLEGESAGVRIELQNSPNTILSLNGDICEEFKWLAPTPSSGYQLPSRLTGRTAHSAPWLNRELGIFAEIFVESSMDDYLQSSSSEEKAWFLKWWNQSLFVVMSERSFQKLQSRADVPKPKYQFKWLENKIFVGWVHGNLGSGWRSTLIYPDEGEKEPIFEVDNDRYLAEYNKLKNLLLAFGGELVEPQRARFFIGSVLEDPWPEHEKGLYRGVDIIEDSIPSPICPTDRAIWLSCVWCLKSGPRESTLIDEAEIAAIFDNLMSNLPEPIQIEYELDLETGLGAHYLLVHITDTSLLQRGAMQKTDILLDELTNLILPIFHEMDSVLIENFENTFVATGHYLIFEAGYGFF